MVMIARDDVERGGSVWLKIPRVTGQMPKRRKAKVIEILGQHTLRIQTIDDGQERIIRYNEADPDEDYLSERERRAAERRERILREHEERGRNGAPAPSSEPAPAPAIAPAPAPTAPREPLTLQLVPKIATKIRIPEKVVQLVTRQQQAKKLQPMPNPTKPRGKAGGIRKDAQTTVRMRALVEWLHVSIIGKSFGSQSRLAHELGVDDKWVSAVLRGHAGVQLRRAVEIAAPFGFDADYFTRADYVPPELWAKRPSEPAPAPAKTNGAAPPAPAAPPTAPPAPIKITSTPAAAPAAPSIETEVLAPIDRELATLESERAALQASLERNVARTAELTHAKEAIASAFRGLSAVNAAVKAIKGSP